METRRLLKICMAFLVCSAFVPISAEALQLSTAIKKGYSEMLPGTTAGFSVLLWTTENKTYPVKIVVVTPQGWKAKAEPAEFVLSPVPENYEIVNIGDRKAFAIPVMIYVKSPENAAEGTYRIKAMAVAGNAGGGHLSVLQERVFEFTAVIGKQPSTESLRGRSQNILDYLGDAITGAITGFASASGRKEAYYIIVIAGILAISYIIYRRSG